MNNTTTIVNLFFAAPQEEGEGDLNALSDYINEINTIYHSRGLYFHLSDSRDLSKITDEIEKESIICDNKIFAVFLYKNTDSQVLAAFEEVLEAFNKKGTPKILTFFRETLPGESRSEEVVAFMKRLDKELGHFYSIYSDINSVKLSLLLELARDRSLAIDANMSDSLITSRDKPLIDAQNIPIYANNAKLRALKEKKAEVEEKIRQMSEDTSKGEKHSELLLLSDEVNKLEEEAKKIEREILSLAETISSYAFSDGITERMKVALRLYEKGEYEKVKELLGDEQREVELNSALHVADESEKRIGGYIEESILLIKTLCAQGVNALNSPEITEIYEKCRLLTEKYNLDKSFYLYYANFLWEQKQYKKAVEISKALADYWAREKTSPANEASIYNLLGILFNTYQDDLLSEEYHLKALDLRERLAKNNPSAYEGDLAQTYNNLGLLYRNMKKFDKAEEYLLKCIGIRTVLEDRNPGEHEELLGEGYNNLGAVYFSRRCYKECEQAWLKAMEIREKLHAINPQAYRSAMAQNCNNLGWLYNNLRKYNSAQEYLTKGLELVSLLAKENPAAYEGTLAQSYSNLALLYLRMEGREKESEEAYLNSLRIKESLYEFDSEAYGETLAFTLNDLGGFYYKVHQYNKAEEYLKRSVALGESRADSHRNNSIENAYANLGLVYTALKLYNQAEVYLLKAQSIRKELYSENPEIYAQNIAGGYFNLANLYYNLKQFDKAEENYHLCLEFYDEMIKSKGKELYRHELAGVYNNLGALYALTHRGDKALETWLECIGIYENLAKEYPKIYRTPLKRAYSNMRMLYESQGLSDNALEYALKEEEIVKSEKGEE